jgi:predicted nucleic acid-binding protein
MRVVADASPLRYLILIGHIDLLPTLFTQIIIPRAVMGELQRVQTPPLVRRWMQHLPVWCVVRTPQQPLATGLEVLGAGEREALALAEELHADLVLIDEDKGRQIARSLGLRAPVPSPGPPSPIHMEDSPSHVRCRRRGQEDNCSQQLPFPAQPPHRREQLHTRALLVVHTAQTGIGDHLSRKPGGS